MCLFLCLCSVMCGNEWNIECLVAGVNCGDWEVLLVNGLIYTSVSNRCEQPPESICVACCAPPKFRKE